MQEPVPELIPGTLARLVDPSRTALLVYDMQVGIQRQIKGAEQVVKACARLIEGARRAGMRIVYTRHLSMPKGWLGASQYRTAMAWQKTSEPSLVKSPFLSASASAAIVPELAPTAADLVLEKYSMSAFAGTALEFAFRDAGLQAVIICGIALEIGIEPTVRHATDLGLVSIVAADACGSGNAEAGVRVLETMRFIGEAVLSDSTTLAALLSPEGS